MTRTNKRDERGVVLVWLAVTLVLLLGITAFAVDVAYWQVTKTREQRAADAAALAGAVTFPGSPSRSNASAQVVASDNGYDVSTVSPLAADGGCPITTNTTVCAGEGDQTYQYKVTVAQRVNNFFGGIFGIGTTVVKATAQAEFLRPLKMGSPSNQFGNDPDNSTWPINAVSPPTSYPNFWGNINGGGTAKQQGDAYAANWCDAPNGSLVTDGCRAIGNGNNNDYTGDGYYYAVDFTNSGTANLQVFDPALVNVGQLCTTNDLANAAALTNIPGYPQGQNNTADIQKRFRPVGANNSDDPTDPGFQYCTGDNTFPNSAGQTVVPSTTYTVLKATIPGHPESATQVCAPKTFAGYNGSVRDALRDNSPTGFATYFRQWANLCTITGQAGDGYFIQVQTDNGGGSNHFALRGVSGVNTNNPAPVTVAGNTYMGMWANVGSNQRTKFYLVRVPSAAKSHTLLLNFYDIGDAGSANQSVTGRLQVLPPTDSNVSGQVFDKCKWSGNSASGATGTSSHSTSSPWGPLTDIGATCTIPGVNNVSANWNAQWSTVTVPIPSNYSCNDADPRGCWLTIDYEFNGIVHDVTSWTAALLGDPVRLVK